MWRLLFQYCHAQKLGGVDMYRLYSSAATRTSSVEWIWRLLFQYCHSHKLGVVDVVAIKPQASIRKPEASILLEVDLSVCPESTYYYYYYYYYCCCYYYYCCCYYNYYDYYYYSSTSCYAHKLGGVDVVVVMISLLLL